MEKLIYEPDGQIVGWSARDSSFFLRLLQIMLEFCEIVANVNTILKIS
jgi:hypothetical protein